MQLNLLGIYLNDHLAGATIGAGLSRHVARRHVRTLRGSHLTLVADEIAQDRRTLLRIMQDLGVPVRRYKIWAGWAAERTRRLKPNGILHRSSALDAVMELETLRLGVEGKSLLWITLLALAPGQSQLDEPELRGLLDRARHQIDTLEEMRRTAAEAVLTRQEMQVSDPAATG